MFEVPMTVYLPSGLRRVSLYSEAVKIVKAETKAVRIRRWSESGIQHEDFLDAAGNMVAQIECGEGYPPMMSGFEYV